MRIAIVIIIGMVTTSFSKCNKISDDTICDCIHTMEEMLKEIKRTNNDPARMKEIELRYKPKVEKCKRIAEKMSDEEKKDIIERAKKCK